MVGNQYFYYKPSPLLTDDVNEKLERVGKTITDAIEAKHFKDYRICGREKMEQYAPAIFKINKSNLNKFDIIELREMVSFMADDDSIINNKSGTKLFNLLIELCDKYIDKK